MRKEHIVPKMSGISICKLVSKIAVSNVNQVLVNQQNSSHLTF